MLRCGTHFTIHCIHCSYILSSSSPLLLPSPPLSSSPLLLPSPPPLSSPLLLPSPPLSSSPLLILSSSSPLLLPSPHLLQCAYIAGVHSVAKQAANVVWKHCVCPLEDYDICVETGVTLYRYSVQPTLCVYTPSMKPSPHITYDTLTCQ